MNVTLSLVTWFFQMFIVYTHHFYPFIPGIIPVIVTLSLATYFIPEFISVIVTLSLVICFIPVFVLWVWPSHRSTDSSKCLYCDYDPLIDHLIHPYVTVIVALAFPFLARMSNTHCIVLKCHTKSRYCIGIGWFSKPKQFQYQTNTNCVVIKHGKIWQNH